MIAESYYWKKPLLAMAKRLTKLKTAHDLSEKTYVQLEKDIFIGFYSIRKLLESVGKVTDSAKDTKVELSWYASTGTEVTWRNNHKLDELYNLNKVNQEVRDIWFVCSRIIHSFIFVQVLNKQECLEGVFFTSDTDKAKKLYFLDIDTVIDVFRLFGNDLPTFIYWSRNPETGEEVMTVK